MEGGADVLRTGEWKVGWGTLCQLYFPDFVQESSHPQVGGYYYKIPLAQCHIFFMNLC